ncbi:hypothetical protein ACIBF1_45645 [Spirillospora sp. NPDC050679]
MNNPLRNGLAKAAVVAVSTATGIAGLVVAAAPAGATGSGSCVTNDMCVYYRTGLYGAYYGHYAKINYQGRYFGGRSDGNGQHVRNNAASGKNYDPNCAFRIYVYPHGTPNNPSQYYGAGAWGNLNGTLNNNNAAQNFFC